MKGKIAVVCSNEVQKGLINLLCEKGYECECIDALNKSRVCERLKSFDNIILPFPSKRENLVFLPDEAKLSDLFSQNQLVIGGMMSDEMKENLEEFEIKYIDYFDSESYVLKNAYLTSQGAVKLLFDNASDYLVGKHVLVTGFGRIGKSLALMLKAIGLKVYVVARRDEALADASSLGFDVFRFSQLKSTLFYFDYIFNTVPSTVFSEKDIERIGNDTIYFELASKPYGADKEFFERYGKKHILAAALPGRFYPKAVAENIFSFITANGGD